MSDSLLQQLIFSLLGGLVGTLIGAGVGGYLTYKGAIDAAKKQTDFLYSQERENRTYQEKQQEGAMMHALKIEIEENLMLAKNLAIGDAENISTYDARDIYKGNVLTSEAWDIYKGNITKLSDILQTTLLQVYIEVRKYNSLIEYERIKIPYGDVYLNPLIEEQAKKVVNICQPAIEELSKKLSLPQTSHNGKKATPGSKRAKQAKNRLKSTL